MPRKHQNSYWVSMRLRSFSDIKLENGAILRDPTDQPCKFLTAFKRRKDAVEDSGDESLVIEIRPVE